MPRSPELDKKVLAFMEKYTTTHAEIKILLSSHSSNIIIIGLLNELSTISPDEISICLEDSSSDEEKLARFP